MDSIGIAWRKNIRSRAYRALRVRDKVSRLWGGSFKARSSWARIQGRGLLGVWASRPGVVGR